MPHQTLSWTAKEEQLMMTKNDNTAAGQSVVPEPDKMQTALPPAVKEPSLWRRWLGLGTAGVAPELPGMQPSRRTMLSLGTVALPLIYCVGAKSARAEPVSRLWDSASVLIGNGGILQGPDVAQCQLFDTDGRALENGTVTADLTMLTSNGTAKFTWRANGGKLEGNFRFPDAKTPAAFAPIPGGAPNQFYLLACGNHTLATDVSGLSADGFFARVTRIVTKCQYAVSAVQVGQTLILHPLAPFCTKCVYIFIRDRDEK